MMTLTEEDTAKIRTEVLDSIVRDADLSLRKRPVSIRITSLYLDHRSFADIRASMAEFESEYPQYTSFELRQHGDGFSDEKYTYVYGIREETDDELIDREVSARESALLAERRDREQFEQLSKRFAENNS